MSQAGFVDVTAPSLGVLGLQGSVEHHLAAFARIGVAAREVRRRSDVEVLSHLVIPGGESTTLHHLLELFDLRDEILARYRRGETALFGTCAGAILLGRGDGERPPRFGLLDAALERNAYGRQVDSFTEAIDCETFGELSCVFIRAPRFRRVGSGARVLARRGDEPILVAGPGLLAATFHPELGDALYPIHRYFLRPELWAAPSLEATPTAVAAGGCSDEEDDEQTPQMVRARIRQQDHPRDLSQPPVPPGGARRRG